MLAMLHILKRAEFSQVWQHLVACTNFPPEQEVNRVFLDPETFNTWKNTIINISMNFDPKRGSAVDLLKTDVVDRLKEMSPTEKKPFLLIGNDFSLRIMLFTLVLEGSDLLFLKKYFSSELQTVSKYLEYLNITEQGTTSKLANFVEKYLLLTLVNKLYRKKPELQSIYERVFSDKNYDRLGLKRLLYGARRNKQHRSIIAEPVDYWDPKKLDYSVLRDEQALIQNLFKDLMVLGQPIISVPYMIGQMSAELATKFIRDGIVDPKRIGFIGKVGNVITSNTNVLERAKQIVIPSMVYPTSVSRNPGIDYPSGEIVLDRNEPVGVTTGASLITVPTVTIETFEDFEHCNAGTICAEMEQYPLVERLDILGVGTQIISGFYVSDHAVSPKVQLRDNNSRNLNTSLSSVEGGVAVFLASYHALKQLFKNSQQK